VPSGCRAAAWLMATEDASFGAATSLQVHSRATGPIEAAVGMNNHSACRSQASLALLCLVGSYLNTGNQITHAHGA
jgi:hypothetical protein